MRTPTANEPLGSAPPTFTLDTDAERSRPARLVETEVDIEAPVELDRSARAYPLGRPFIRILMSDTGGGHRACAEALSVAIGERARVELLDVFGRSDLLGRVTELYDWFGEHRTLWGTLWRLLDGPRRARLLCDPAWWTAPRQNRQLVRAGEPDLVVVVHPLVTAAARRALEGRRRSTGLVTVVTDPVTPHASWFEPDVDELFVATQSARARALACGVPSDRVELAGHPIHPRVWGLAARRDELRAGYGWREPVVLVTGGGGGVGIRESVAAARGQGARVIAICGRDEALARRLAKVEGLEVMGFVDDLPERMCAADLVLSKAGPSTLAECGAVGTPVIVTAHMPGQEDGNLRWVRDADFGEVAERTDRLRATVARWLRDDAGRERLRERATAVSPESADAATKIADRIVARACAVQARGSA